ncbi:hypothetical protein W02_24720 [Nitrospira sp. KM1]|uniref:hypothetical protein n=1 Tax=Nitrospira sp. KM1 TaxID=1936990 RepID=UPI0013A75F98|nr:hypothetical protein [Nitrospira sp. KM1]BCA55332.1 hypothetical protein W02_24720 [Nitrospira sp. KM1]
MNDLLEFHLRSITTDRTGGRTRTGFEFEDFVGADEALSELHYEEGTAGWRATKPRYPESRDFVQQLAHTFVDALALAVDQLFQAGTISRRQIYTALSNSLHERLWQPEVLPTGSLTFTGDLERETRYGTVQDDEVIFSFRHASPQVSQAFLEVASRFKPDKEKHGNLYIE